MKGKKKVTKKMPELPEVEIVSRGMIQKLVGKRIRSIDVRRFDLRWPVPENFQTVLVGSLIKNIRRRAKYILIETDSDYGVLLHLGMSGRIKISDYPSDPPAYEKHDHMQFIMDDGIWVRYFDPRRFGTVQLVENHQFKENPLLRHLGYEPLSDDFSDQRLRSFIENRNAPIKNLIMDQRFIVGVGNIYACEALFDAGINPWRAGKTINSSAANRLCKSVKKILSNAIAAGGSTLKDYRKSDGDLGYFQHQFTVYNQEGKHCKNCKTNIVRRVQAGRSTFYCPECQK
jgi:formamidopyrimidine-DNA glycosylase